MTGGADGDDAPAGDPDDDLLVAVRAGDRRALDDLLRRHQPRLWAVCRRLTGSDADADDAAQDALVSIVRALPRFDGRSRFGTWAYRIAVNASLDELRRRRRRPEPGLPGDADLFRSAGGERSSAAGVTGSGGAGGPGPERPYRAGSTGPERPGGAGSTGPERPYRAGSTGPERPFGAGGTTPDPEGAALSVDVEAALRRLPLEFRAPVVLRDLCGLDYAEIAEVLDLPPGTVRSRISRGRAALAPLLAPGNRAVPSERRTGRP